MELKKGHLKETNQLLYFIEILTQKNLKTNMPTESVHSADMPTNPEKKQVYRNE